MMTCSTGASYLNIELDFIVGRIDDDLVVWCSFTRIADKTNDWTFGSASIVLMSEGVGKCVQHLIEFSIDRCSRTVAPE